MLAPFVETAHMFVPPVVIILYALIPPLIDAFTNELSPYLCYDTPVALALETAFFVFVLVGTVIYCCIREGPLFRLGPSYFLSTARRAVARVFFRGDYNNICFYVAVFLQLLPVTFWALYLRDAPLVCWILITPEEALGFQIGRDGVFLGIGVVLYTLLFFVNKAGRLIPNHASAAATRTEEEAGLCREQA